MPGRRRRTGNGIRDGEGVAFENVPETNYKYRTLVYCGEGFFDAQRVDTFARPFSLKFLSISFQVS